jgi:hypothetical protein
MCPVGWKGLCALNLPREAQPLALGSKELDCNTGNFIPEALCRDTSQCALLFPFISSSVLGQEMPTDLPPIMEELVSGQLSL